MIKNDLGIIPLIFYLTNANAIEWSTLSDLLLYLINTNHIHILSYDLPLL
jgi:hypothetical protein